MPKKVSPLIEPVTTKQARRVDAVQVLQLIQNKILERFVPRSHSAFSVAKRLERFERLERLEPSYYPAASATTSRTIAPAPRMTARFLIQQIPCAWIKAAARMSVRAQAVTCEYPVSFHNGQERFWFARRQIVATLGRSKTRNQSELSARMGSPTRIIPPLTISARKPPRWINPRRAPLTVSFSR